MIYFIRHGKDGAIKIGYVGYEKAFSQRLANLQSGTPVKLHFMGIMDGDLKKEKETHEQFAEHRLRGEWFIPTLTLISFIGVNTREISKDPYAGPEEIAWIRLSSGTKAALQKRADGLGVDLSVVGRWALEWAVTAPLSELRPEVIEVEQE